MPSNHCEGCPLSGIGSPVRVPEASMTRFVVVTDTPSAYNAGEGRLLAKSAAKLLGASMAAAGFAREDFTMFPQSRCPYNKDEFTTKEQKAIRDHCRGYLDDFLKASTPEAIIPLGAEPARQVLGRAVKITKVRGVIEHSQEYGTKVFPMLNPGMVLMYPQHRVTFDMDCIALRDLAEVSYRLKVRARRMLGDYEFIDDLQFLIDAEPDILFYDTETTGLSFFAPGTHDVRDYDPSVHGKEFAPRPAVLTLQFAIEPEKSYMLVWDHPENPVPLRRKRRLREQLRLLLNNPKTRVVGQNAKYDRVFTESCLGVSYPIGGDTLMLATLLDENAISKGQDMLVRQYVPAMSGYADSFNATYDKSRMWEIPLSELISYGCGDTDSGYRLHTVLYDMVRKDRKLLAHYVRVTLPGLNAFAAIEQRGMYVDEAALDVFESVVAQDVEERYQSLISQVPRSIKRAHVEKGLKFSRGDFIRDILFYHKDGFRLTPKVFTQTTAKLPPDKRVASTSSKNHLPYFYDTHPFTYELTEYIQSERLLGTNIRGFKKKYIVDGLVRPTYSLWTAVTGRSACVRADTPVVTSRGVVRADAIRVGDVVFTHAYRWKPVTALFRKDPALMYDVYLSNGEVLSVTAHHRVMLDSGLWADIGYILEGLGYVISQQATDAEPTVSTSCSDDVYTGRSIQYAEGYEIPTVKTSGENSAVQEAAVFRLHGWAGVPNPPRDVSVASGYTRQVLGPRLGITIEKVVCAGVHRVYDFEVAEDHSYLACGVFNHNSENPNGQNIPKRGKLAKAYRRSFVAPRGYLVIEADLSQAELRIAASMANEATMLSVYRNAGDIHTETALIALGITRAKFKELPKAEQKSARQKAKAVNFGFIYGMGWRKFIGYAKTQYGVEFTDEEAQRIRTAFFKKYPGLSSWHERQRQAAMRDGQVRSYSGRIRHLPMIYSDDEMVQQEAGRQSINSPVQEFASSLGIMAIGRLSAEIDPQYLAPIAFVHDAIFCYVKEEYLEWGAKTLKWYMESNPLEEWFGLRLPCPIVADVSFGRNFGDTFEMEGLVLDQPYDFTRFETSDDGGPTIYVPEQYDPPNYGLLAEIDK